MPQGPPGPGGPTQNLPNPDQKQHFMSEKNVNEFNRRDFLRGGSVAAIMSMLGGVELFAQTNETASAAAVAATGPKVKVAVIGLGPWGRDVLNTLARIPRAQVVAVCDNYPAMATRGAKL